MSEPTHTALGTWSGGHYMRFGEPLDDERLEAIFRPDERVRTVITADTYGQGEADRTLSRALADLDREAYTLVGAVGHDFYAGKRSGAKGYPRFTDPSLRGADEYAGYLRMATERSLERLRVDRLDLLLLHNPDRIGYTSDAVWDGLEVLRAEGLVERLGIAPGPANGFTLDVIECLERFGDRIDWAMVILNPLEPWPGELVLPAAARHDVKVITRVVDYGGLFHDDLLPGAELPPGDHRAFRPAGWIEAGRERLERMRPVAERHSLTPLGLACAWNLAHEAVECVVPTLIQETGRAARPVEDKRADLAAVPARSPLSPEEVAQIRTIGDNTGSMALKGASPDHEGEATADRWPLTPELAERGRQFGIDAERDLVRAA